MNNLFGRLLTRQELGDDFEHLPANTVTFPGMTLTNKCAICNRCGTSSLLQTVKLEISAYFCPECFYQFNLWSRQAVAVNNRDCIGLVKR